MIDFYGTVDADDQDEWSALLSRDDMWLDQPISFYIERDSLYYRWLMCACSTVSFGDKAVFWSFDMEISFEKFTTVPDAYYPFIVRAREHFYEFCFNLLRKGGNLTIQGLSFSKA